jgi:hypothetical protein
MRVKPVKRSALLPPDIEQDLMCSSGAGLYRGQVIMLQKIFKALGALVIVVVLLVVGGFLFMLWVFTATSG